MPGADEQGTGRIGGATAFNDPEPAGERLPNEEIN